MMQMMSLFCFLQVWCMLLHMKARIVFARVLIHLLHVLCGNARASSLSNSSIMAEAVKLLKLLTKTTR